MDPQAQGAEEGWVLSIRDFDHVREPLLRRLLDYWLEKRGGRLLPCRRDIDPVDIPWALSRIWVLDYLPDVRRFRYRLAGEEINAVAGANMRGVFLDETLPADRCEMILGKFMDVVENRSIVHDSGRVYLRDERLATGERIILPLSDDAETVDALLGGTVYVWGLAGGAADAGALRQTTTSLRIQTGKSRRSHSSIP